MISLINVINTFNIIDKKNWSNESLIAYLPLDDSHIRSNHRRCFIKEVFLKLRKIDTKHLYLFFNKFAGLELFLKISKSN